MNETVCKKRFTMTLERRLRLGRKVDGGLFEILMGNEPCHILCTGRTAAARAVVWPS